jgi:phenylpropionate dioxygenase-like ring-hydroxylating dioxygenase large terminal subunit
MSIRSLSPESRSTLEPYSAYYLREVPDPDSDLTRTGPGTPMGEYLRLFWQPVCLSQELSELPKAITILGEKLVAFRDRGGRVGVLQRHCPHRGASLEFGIVQKTGIRCSYHGWLFDVDGRVLETPCEPAGSPRKDTVIQGAYPAFEREGLVFAYMGPPEKRPAFPEYDSYTLPAGTRLVPFSNVYPCNWLQVCENIMDHMHTAVLHNNMTVEGVDAAIAAGTSLAGFGDMPTMHWETTRNGNAMVFVAARRLPEDKVWIRISEMVLPNYTQIGSLAPTASKYRHSTTSLTRWHVPVDDVNMIIFGWRHFNDEIDPDRLGRPQDCGVDKIDFLAGQTGSRSYEEGQRAPGDWEVICSQRSIAVHGLEHPATSDAGVLRYRRLLRDAIAGKTGADTSFHRACGETIHQYAQDSLLTVPAKAGDDDKALLLELNRRLLALIQEGDTVPPAERDRHVRRRLDELEREFTDR